MISAPDTSEPRIRDRQHKADDLSCRVPFSRIHIVPQITHYTRRNLRMESILPNTPTIKPVMA